MNERELIGKYDAHAWEAVAEGEIPEEDFFGLMQYCGCIELYRAIAQNPYASPDVLDILQENLMEDEEHDYTGTLMMIIEHPRVTESILDEIAFHSDLRLAFAAANHADASRSAVTEVLGRLDMIEDEDEWYAHASTALKEKN